MSGFNVEVVEATTIRGCTGTLVPTISLSVLVLGTRTACSDIEGTTVNAVLLYSLENMQSVFPARQSLSVSETAGVVGDR